MDRPEPDLSNWMPPAPPGPMVLTGRYARLDPLAPDHAPDLHRANLADASIWDWLPYGPFDTEADYRAWLEQVAGRADPLFFAITAEGSTGPSGVASLMRIAPASGSIEIGHICLSRALQRTTAASEMVFLFADWAFAAGYRRLEWKCNAANLRSRRTAERAGFSYEGVFRNHMIVKGRNRDTAWFAITDADWACLCPAWRGWLDPANFDPAGRQLRRLGDLTGVCRVASDPDL